MTDTTRPDHAEAMSLGREWNPVWKQLERDVTLATSHVHDRTWIEIAYRVVTAAIDQGIVVEAAERDALVAACRDLAWLVSESNRGSHHESDAVFEKHGVAHLFDRDE